MNIFWVLIVIGILVSFISEYFFGDSNKYKYADYANQIPNMDSRLECMIEEYLLYANNKSPSFKSGSAFCARQVTNETEFHHAFDVLTNALVLADKERNPQLVNLLICYMLKKYYKMINDYGNSLEKATFNRMLKVLKMNNIIK